MNTFTARAVHNGIIETRTRLEETCRSVDQPIAEMLENIDTIIEDHDDAGVEIPPEFRSLLHQYRTGVEALQNAVAQARRILAETADRYT